MGGGIVAFPAIWDFSGKVAMVTSAARHRPGDKRCSIMSPSRTASAVVLAAGVLASPAADAQDRGPAATLVPPAQQAQQGADQATKGASVTPHPYVGMWVTADGHVRQELLCNNRYDEARGSRRSAYQGRYEVRGNQIVYWDDTGFTADGVFVSHDELHHGGIVFRRVQ